MVFLKCYFAALSPGRLTLWCSFIWYLVIAVRYFDGDAKLWTTSLGLTAIVGSILTINACPAGGGPRSLDKWQLLRFFLIPFCVSSFSALVKGRGFVLIFPPEPRENLTAGGACFLFCLFVLLTKRLIH
ncbi:MAG: hypothetical protein HY735_01765 [Verrucomicrobia bacterium]|nr:hypothetical protein [Verrucomicrobiota bacterium]